jgi:hypothetical protein
MANVPGVQARFERGGYAQDGGMGAWKWVHSSR